MGMTIDEALKILDNIPTIGEQVDALEMAIDTMCKYQKIQEIVNSNPDYIHHTDMDAYKLNSIREVIEDGNNSD